jgi:hypothetical protein
VKNRRYWRYEMEREGASRSVVSVARADAPTPLGGLALTPYCLIPHPPWPDSQSDRGWIKVKNRSYWRYELERESVINSRRQGVFV